MRLTVRVHPGAARDRLGELAGGVLAVWLRARPVENRANEALVEFLAERLGLRKQDVRLVSGHRGRQKLVELPLASADELARRLAGAKD